MYRQRTCEKLFLLLLPAVHHWPQWFTLPPLVQLGYPVQPGELVWPGEQAQPWEPVQPGEPVPVWSGEAVEAPPRMPARPLAQQALQAGQMVVAAV